MYQTLSFTLGHIRVEPLESSIYLANGEKQGLQPKFIDVLSYLAERYPQVVSRSELIEHIWLGNSYVGEKALTNAIWHLRQAMQQNSDDEVIQTIRKSGYQLLKAPEFHAKVVHQSALPPAKKKQPTIMMWGAAVLIAGLLMLWWFSQNQASIAQSDIINITTEPGLELFPAPSPDGRYLVYKWLSPDGKADLYQRDVSQPLVPPKRLTFDDASEGSAVWSRDGSQLYFRRKDMQANYCDIVRMDMQSLQETFIAKCPMTGALHYLDIAPDNLTLAYWGIGPDSEQPGIYLLDLGIEHATPRRLPCSDNCLYQDRDMAFSPDGKILAITKRRSRFSEDIYLLDLVKGTEIRATVGEMDVVGLSWHPNGKSLVYGVQRSDVRMGFELVIEGLKSYPLNIRGFSYPAFARQQPWLFFQHRDEQYHIAAQSVSEDVSSSPFPILQSGYNHKYPDYSAATQQIAYVSNESGYYEVWLADANGQQRIQITELQRSVRFPKWSHSGKYVAFLAADPQGEGDHIYIVDVSTRKVIPVPSSFSRHNRPTWTPDDSAIISAVYEQEVPDIYRFSIAELNISRLTWDGGRYGVVLDDNSLVYTRTKKGLYKKSLEAKNTETLLDAAEFSIRYTWEYTPQGVYFLKANTEHQQIGFYDWQKGQFKALLKLPASSVVTDSNMSFDLKGQRLLFTKTLFYQSDIKLLKNPVMH
jgi:Tol biopolymer transport system component/DNA-binding winged helix-turn-helix (wHTH) protein